MAKAKIDLRPDTLDLELYAGDGVSIQLDVMDNAGDAIPADGEITGQIRVNRLDTEFVAEFAADLTVAETGKVVVSLTGEQTAALIDTEPVFNGFWDIQWVAPALQPITLVQGKVRCYADVTR